jgi:hypothetical protein
MRMRMTMRRMANAKAPAMFPNNPHPAFGQPKLGLVILPLPWAKGGVQNWRKAAWNR